MEQLDLLLARHLQQSTPSEVAFLSFNRRYRNC
jgi:hypothetical protein